MRIYKKQVCVTKVFKLWYENFLINVDKGTLKDGIFILKNVLKSMLNK